MVTGLGLTQILAFGSSYYLPAVLAGPIAADTGWPLTWVIAGLSLGLLVAGAVSPRVGRAIDDNGGRAVLAMSSVLLAAGLAAIGLAGTLPVFLAGWLVIGAGMGMGLYDAAFGTLGRLYGRRSRSAIAVLTLFGGFASTICWPLSAWLVEAFGWRGACLAYAGLHLALALPIHLLVVPRTPAHPASGDRAVVQSAVAEPLLPRAHMLPFALLALCITLSSFLSSVIAVNMLLILQERGLELAAAVGLGMLIGPAQVGARVVETLFGRHYHPIWTKTASVLLMAGGLALMLAGSPLVAAGLVLYGAGIGIESIARGTLPLALFGERRYAALLGRLAMPSLLAQALAPLLGAWAMQRGGAGLTLSALTGLAFANVAFVVLLFAATRPLRVVKPSLGSTP